MNPTFIALAAVFLAIAAGSFAGAARRPDPAGARKQRIAAGLMTAAAVAFIAAGLISRPV